MQSALPTDTLLARTTKKPSVPLTGTTYLYIYLSTYIPTYIHTYLLTYISTYLATYIPAYLPIYLPTYLPTYLSIYLSTYLSAPLVYVSLVPPIDTLLAPPHNIPSASLINKPLEPPAYARCHQLIFHWYF